MHGVVRLTDHLDMTIVVDWVIKPQIKQISLELVIVTGLVYYAVEEAVISEQSAVLKDSGRSLIYARKRSEPTCSTVPCGGPDSTSALEEWAPSRATSCFLFPKKAMIQELVLFRMP